ncbi:MAG: hypothetical protein MZU79_05285 [Anaerotruncus sp.]|nr:hypothetical protein [Anaerotruncus sp.]
MMAKRQAEAGAAGQPGAPAAGAPSAASARRPGRPADVQPAGRRTGGRRGPSADAPRLDAGQGRQVEHDVRPDRRLGHLVFGDRPQRAQGRRRHRRRQR